MTLNIDPPLSNQLILETRGISNKVFLRYPSHKDSCSYEEA